MKLSLIFIAFVVVLCGCQYNPYTITAPTKRPKFEDVVGVYEFYYETVSKHTSPKEFKRAAITLNADSTFTITGLPNFVGPVNFKYKGNINATGKWGIENMGDLDAKQETLFAIALKGTPANLPAIGFLHHKAPYELIIIYGDPDNKNVMIFKNSAEKEKSQLK